MHSTLPHRNSYAKPIKRCRKSCFSLHKNYYRGEGVVREKDSPLRGPPSEPVVRCSCRARRRASCPRKMTFVRPWRPERFRVFKKQKSGRDYKLRRLRSIAPEKKPHHVRFMSAEIKFIAVNECGVSFIFSKRLAFFSRRLSVIFIDSICKFIRVHCMSLNCSARSDMCMYGTIVSRPYRSGICQVIAIFGIWFDKTYTFL